MSGSQDIIDDLQASTRELSHALPQTWAGFAVMHQAAVADGVLPAKVKELIALAIAVAKECDGCIAYHAKAAARRGATADEVAEALGVALLMDGSRSWSNWPTNVVVDPDVRCRRCSRRHHEIRT